MLLRDELSKMNSCSLEQLLVRCSKENFIQNRKVTLHGQANQAVQGWDRVKVFIGQDRQFVLQNADGKWEFEVPLTTWGGKRQISFESVNENVQVNVAGLFATAFRLEKLGELSLFVKKTNRTQTGFNPFWRLKTKVLRTFSFLPAGSR